MNIAYFHGYPYFCFYIYTSMKRYSLFFLGLIHQWFLVAQQNIDVTADYLEISAGFTDSIYSPSGNIVFSNRQDPNTGSLSLFGLHFTNRTTTVLKNHISGRTETDTTCTDFGSCEEPQWYDSPLIGVHGSNTVVEFSGNMRGDNSRSDPTIYITDTGRFVVKANAYIDLVFSRWTNFTRSLYVAGDGTGIFEIEDGYVSDRSALGTKPCGTGAIRFSNAVFVSHSSAALPYYYRPKMSDTHAKINSHLVFHNIPGSRWIVKSNDQIFPGGFWVYENMTLETQRNLTLTGQIDTFKYNENYVNYGGMMFFNTNRTLTKTGPGRFVINGDQAYSSGSTMNINEGTLEWMTDPYMYGTFHFTKDKNFYTGLNLIVNINGLASVKASAAQVYLNTLSVNSSLATVFIKYGCKLNATTAALNGRLVITIPSSVTLNINDVISVLTFGTRSGRFVEVYDSLRRYSWDTTRLYSHGELKVTGITTISKGTESLRTLVFPNPCNGSFTVELSKALLPAGFMLYSCDGQCVYSSLLSNTESIHAVPVPSGLYYYHIRGAGKKIADGKLVIR